MSQAPRNPIPKPRIIRRPELQPAARAPINAQPVSVPPVLEVERAPVMAAVASANLSEQPFAGPSDQWIEHETNAAGLIDNTFIYMYDGTQNARGIAQRTLRDVESVRLVTTRGPAR